MFDEKLEISDWRISYGGYELRDKNGWRVDVGL
jgi:hypothetical protein